VKRREFIMGRRFELMTVFLGLLLSGCGINTIPTLDENAKAKWSDVQNQYQRRADLIPNLVETVKGYAAQERQVLTDQFVARKCQSGSFTSRAFQAAFLC
jgi:LemA protein